MRNSLNSNRGGAPMQGQPPTIFSILGSLMGGNAGDPYSGAAAKLSDYYNQGESYQDPYVSMGRAAMPDYSSYVHSMSDAPSYINNLLSSYKTSPAEQYAQSQAMRAAQNAASASGMTGSTPFLKSAQTQAENIANQYQQQYLQNALGISSRYGSGLRDMVGMGQHASDQMTSLSESEAKAQAEMEYGRRQADQNQKSEMWSGIGSGVGSLIAGLL